MAEPIIIVEDLSKQYALGASAERYKTLRESLMSGFRRPVRIAAGFRNAGNLRPNDRPTFWALDGLSCVVGRGEVLGVIGQNGAGKSTFLKLLSQITEPSRGCIKIKGRVASLLEVGTGFHPELTGAENILLNGAVLGMSRSEILAKFDEIVAFAEVRKFIDTPVKHYSSGMYLRLAFSVAAHLEPEVLLVDEVLAVGDAAFQQKCLGKMDSVAKGGRTVLLVSHNLNAIKQLCSRVLYLETGKLKMDGDPETVIAAYLRTAGATTPLVDLTGFHNNYGHGEISVLSVGLVHPESSTFSIGWDQPLGLVITVVAHQRMENIEMVLGLKTAEGVQVFTARSTDVDPAGMTFEAEQINKVYCNAKHNIRAGSYEIMIGITSGIYVYYYNPDAARLEISDVLGKQHYPERNFGLINCDVSWSVEI